MLLECWNWEPTLRPDFEELIDFFEGLSEEHVDFQNDNISDTVRSASNPVLQEPDSVNISDPDHMLSNGEPNPDSVDMINVQFDLNLQQSPENVSNFITAMQSGTTDNNSDMAPGSDGDGIELRPMVPSGLVAAINSEQQDVTLQRTDTEPNESSSEDDPRTFTNLTET